MSKKKDNIPLPIRDNNDFDGMKNFLRNFCVEFNDEEYDGLELKQKYILNNYCFELASQRSRFELTSDILGEELCKKYKELLKQTTLFSGSTERFRP